MFARVLPLIFIVPTWLSAATYYVDPATGSPQNNGSAQAPWKTLEEVLKKHSALKGGDVVLLRGGFHGEVNLSGAHNQEVVTVAAEAGQIPQIRRLQVNDSSKWTFRGLEISPALGGGGAYDGNIVVLGDRGENKDLTLEDSFIYTELDSSKWSVDDWIKKANSGIFMGRAGENVTVRNCYVYNTRFGIAMCGYHQLCEGCVIRNFSGDGMRMTRDDETAQYNVIKNNYVSGQDGDANHDDGIQCFLFNVGTGTLRRQTVRGNIILNREDDAQPFHNPMQGIGFFDGPLIDFLVEKNVICVNHWHGVCLCDAQNCKILDNVAYTRWDDRMRPWVKIGGKQGAAKGNTVKGNLACTFDFKADPEVTAENNEPVTKEKYEERLKALEAEIDSKFGRFHPVAKFARLSNEQGENTPRKPAAPEGPAGAGKAKAAPSAATPVLAAPPPPEEKPIPDAALATWRKRLVERVAAATKEGKHPRVYLNLFGKQAEYFKLQSCDPNNVVLLAQDSPLPWPWEKLDRKDRFQVLRSIADETRATDLALSAVWAAAAGQRAQADDFLAKASLVQRPEDATLLSEARALVGGR